jgi:hypothetical protein
MKVFSLGGIRLAWKIFHWKDLVQNDNMTILFFYFLLGVKSLVSKVSYKQSQLHVLSL